MAKDAPPELHVAAPELDSLPQATAFLGRTEGGGSGAVLLRFDDGVGRVTKLLGNGQDGDNPVQFVLVNELVVARLAAMIEAPCPKGAAVWVDEPYVEEARREVSNLARAKAGPAFGREWVEGSAGPSVETCREALNRASLAGLIVLYTWTWNTDFKSDHLLRRQATGGGIEVLGFDHGHCFNNAWSEDIRNHVPEVISGEPLSLVVSGTDFEPFLERLVGLSKETLDPATLNLPPPWGVGEATRSALAEYLRDSRDRVVQAIRDRFQAG